MTVDLAQPKDKRILQAAEEVFSRHGYEKATLDEIIALADVGKGTVYKYFGNKEQLFYKLVADKNAPFVKRLAQAVAGEDSFEEKLKRYFKEMVAFYVANSTLWQIICFEMLGNCNGYRVEKIEGEFQVFSRYHSVELAEGYKEQILRYHNLLYSEFDILQQLITEAMQKGLLKQNCMPEIATKFVFFGVAMSIFNPNADETNELSVEQAAEIIVDHFLRGNGASL